MTPYAKGKIVRGRWEPFRMKDGRLVLAVKASNEKRLKAWRKHVTLIARHSQGAPRTPLVGPVEVELLFTFVRGASSKSDPEWCDNTATGDIDKLTRAAFDALTDAGWWDDDTRACRLVAEARWGSHDAVRIRARAMRERDAGQLNLLGE